MLVFLHASPQNNRSTRVCVYRSSSSYVYEPKFSYFSTFFHPQFLHDLCKRNKLLLLVGLFKNDARDSEVPFFLVCAIIFGPSGGWRGKIEADGRRAVVQRTLTTLWHKRRRRRRRRSSGCHVPYGPRVPHIRRAIAFPTAHTWT